MSKRNVGESVIIKKKKENVKTNYRKIRKKKKRIMTWMLIWLNWNVITINIILRLLDAYRLVCNFVHIHKYN